MYCLANICYVCLEKKTKLINNINSSLSVNKDIIDIIGYPPFNLAWLKTKRIILICEECCLRLRETYQFLKMCLKNSALLQGYMDNLDTKEGELLVHVNIQHNGINPVKCEIKLEDEVINTIEPITEETEDVSVDFEDPLVEEKVICKTEEVHLEEEYLMDDNSTESINNDESDSEISVNSNAHITNTGRVHSDKEPYKCGICKKSFKYKSKLLCHMLYHTGEKPYECSVCDKGTTSKSDLDKHMRVHTGERPFECCRCKKCFTTISSLLTHMQIHTGEKPYKCTICTKCFNQRTNLMRHMRTHTGEKPFECSTCKKCFSAKTSLVDHMLIHTGERPFTCTRCNKSFRYRRHLMAHFRVHTGEKPYDCSICKLRFSQRRYLKSHMKSHTNKKTNQCNRMFVDSEDPLIEENVNYKMEEVYVKEEHPMDNNSTESMNKELDSEISANTNADITNTDRVRSELTYKEENVTNTVDLNTLAKKSYKCATCSKTYCTEKMLMKHTRVHTGEEPYKCTVCDKCFILKSHFVCHMRTHTGEKKLLECSVCGKCFRFKADLDRHKRVHTGEKPYECSTCKRCFSTRSYLVHHTRTHTGERPYECSRCKKCFITQYNLGRHMQIHTREIIYQCTHENNVSVDNQI